MQTKPSEPIRVDKGATLDLLGDTSPATSATSDVPVIETKPDAAVKPESAPAAEVEQQAEHEEQPDAPESEAQPADAAAQPDAKKPARGVQKRIDELVKGREDEKRRADALQAMLDRELQARTAKPAPEEAKPVDTEEAAPVRPSKSDFTDPDAYDRALEDYVESKASYQAERRAREVIEGERQAYRQTQIQAAQDAARLAYQGRVEKVVAEYPDYHEIAESPDVQVSVPMAHAILNSEHGPKIQYYLGKNPAEAQRITALNPALQLVELGLIAAKLTAPAAQVPAAKPVSAAPKPLAPLATGGETRTPSGEEESMEAYAARRKKEIAASQRPGARLN